MSVVEDIIVKMIDTRAGGSLEFPLGVGGERESEAYADTSADGRCVAVMVLIAVFALGSDIIVCQSGMYADEETVVFCPEPISPLRHDGQCAEFKCCLEIIESGIVNRYICRPMWCDVYFCGDIGP